jgi:hypothetical protein
MADMTLHEDNCDGNSRVSAKHRACHPAVGALELAAQVRAALADASRDFLAFHGSRLAKPSAGFAR